MRGILISNLVLNVFIFLILCAFIVAGIIAKDHIKTLIPEQTQ